jgi:hypothetical protein
VATNVRVLSGVPQDKLQQVVRDLEYEVGKENIRVSLQPDGLWRVEYAVEGLPGSSSDQRSFAGSASGSGSSFNKRG